MDDLISRQAAIDATQGIGRLATLPDNDPVIRMSAVEYVLFNLPSAQPQRWIPCSERLPEPDSVYKDDPTYYLVQDEYGDMMVAKFIKFPGGARVWQQIHQYGAIMEDIVAWMPLPEPWRGEEDEQI